MFANCLVRLLVTVSAITMSNLGISSGRKKPRTKESKPPTASRSDRPRSSLTHLSASTAAVDDANAITPIDAPYVCTGRFGVDFIQLCRRAYLSYIPNVAARPRRPVHASGVDDKKSMIQMKPGAKLATSSQLQSHATLPLDQSLAFDASEGFIPEPPPKTYLLRDSISFFRPAVQVFPFNCSCKMLHVYCKIFRELFCCVIMCCPNSSKLDELQ